MTANYTPRLVSAALLIAAIVAISPPDSIAQPARTEKLGPAHPDTAKQRLSRARVLAALGQTNEAVSDALAAEAIGRADARRVARFLPESRALQYAGERAQGLDVAISALCAAPGPAADVKRVAGKYLTSKRVVLSIVPMGKTDLASKPAESKKVTQ